MVCGGWRSLNFQRLALSFGLVLAWLGRVWLVLTWFGLAGSGMACPDMAWLGWVGNGFPNMDWHAWPIKGLF